MSEYEDHFVNDGVMKVMDKNNTYQAERDFTSLMAWQKAREVKLFFYNKILPKLPKEEKYNLDI